MCFGVLKLCLDANPKTIWVCAFCVPLVWLLHWLNFSKDHIFFALSCWCLETLILKKQLILVKMTVIYCPNWWYNKLIFKHTCLASCAHFGMSCRNVSMQSGFHAVLTPISLWITEASSWTPSCHVTTWTECAHPLAREPGLAKGILHRRANSTNAPVRPKWQILSAMGFPVYFCMCAQHNPERGP